MMFDFSTIDEVRLSAGNHSKPENGLCFMEMAAWFAGEKHSDEPDCSCPVLGAYGIRLNDGMPDDTRDRLLKPLVPLIVGTRDSASELKRAQFLAMWATNKVLPIILRRYGFNDCAEQCEMARTLVEARSAAAYAAANAANAANAAAYAANAARTAANAAAYAADAAANAANAARTAANAAAYAADAARTAAREEIWAVAVEGLRQAILIGRHESLTDFSLIIERRARLRELIA